MKAGGVVRHAAVWLAALDCAALASMPHRVDASAEVGPYFILKEVHYRQVDTSPRSTGFNVVTPKLRVTALTKSVSGGIELQLTVIGLANETYDVESTPDLVQAFQAFAPVNSAPTGAIQYTTAATTALRMFYRIAYPSSIGAP